MKCPTVGRRLCRWFYPVLFKICFASGINLKNMENPWKSMKIPDLQMIFPYLPISSHIFPYLPIFFAIKSGISVEGLGLRNFLRGCCLLHGTSPQQRPPTSSGDDFGRFLSSEKRGENYLIGENYDHPMDLQLNYNLYLWWTNILPWKDPPFLIGKSTISTGPWSMAKC